jgi:hypothetical protein
LYQHHCQTQAVRLSEQGLFSENSRRLAAIAALRLPLI